MTRREDWCPCSEHDGMVELLDKAIKTIDEHSRYEDTHGAPAWVRREHTALRQMGRMYMKALLAHIRAEEKTA